MSHTRAFMLRQASQQLAQLTRASSLRLASVIALRGSQTCSGIHSYRYSNTAAATRALHTPAKATSKLLTSTSLRSGVALPSTLRVGVVPVRTSFYASGRLGHQNSACAAPLFAAQRCYGTMRPTRPTHSPKKSESTGGQLQGVNNLERYKGEEEEERKEGGGDKEDPFNMNSGPGYLPFPPPFHTINIVMILFLANVLCYFVMNFGNDDWRDFIVEHFTLSHENWTRIYPLFTNAFYQEHLLQLLIDCWLLWQFGDTMLGFLGNTRMAFFAMLCTLGGSLIHIARQKFELHYGMDELEVRGRCYGPNPFIMGLIAIEGLIFRHLNFIQQPPIPFLVLTAFVMVIDVWRIFTTKPEEHGAATGGALMAYLFWALPTRMLGLDKLTATL
ncbi:putative mitochondrial rhomboid-like protein [Leptomonas pyrrhocoris]|uniref:Putative mitochondrial rhomboid-like protein n=1 Tax=Leptomonas pyrrhocoris TaxID=157538 RepID=A0A0N1J4E1_LEPPY|nr:putative mitochondrial rhomboid-like protein [Leptomonas pyrrhocoris]KPA75574.1 putative mitochondrial rhomboid-like protein [Leptomonas pyrrhocoris]|eukprot:XP_015654013.1 putative mitochondrial rhomboid-like protein [Leptomonas pyrrhocoris]